LVWLKPHALPQQFEIGKAHLPRRRPRHGSIQQAVNRRPLASRSAAHPVGGIGRLFGAVANHLSNERHCVPHWQAQFTTEKRWKCRFCRTILPFELVVLRDLVGIDREVIIADRLEVRR
jgi:hypothetical protein